MSYGPKNYASLIGLPGFSETLLKNHFKLYEGYVANTNKVLELLKGAEAGTPVFAELKRRFGWEFNGMRLHELYFGNLAAGKGRLDSGSPLAKQIAADFGSYEAWEKDYRAVCAMRGIGWAVLAYDPSGKKLMNLWINEHDGGHLAGTVPLLIGDDFEHAYLTDYGLNRADYVSAFLRAVDWAVVSSRFNTE